MGEVQPEAEVLRVALGEGRLEAAEIAADLFAVAGDAPRWLVSAERVAFAAEVSARRAREHYEALLHAWLAELTP